MSEAELFGILAWGWLGVGAIAFGLLWFVTAPYGRHVRSGWGPTISSNLGWVLMECPAVLVFGGFFLLGDRQTAPVHLVFLAMWMLHYVNRAFVFPFRRRGGQRPMPLSIVGGGFLFNLVNGYLQSRWLNTLSPLYDVDWLTDPRFVVGAAVFVAGWAINTHSDGVLRDLRRSKDTGYVIPTRGLFRWVSNANYFGEMVEWTGWAIATWSLPGAVFALWTIANLAPRAFSNHRWYRETFDDYPEHRKALIPFLL